MLTPLNGTKTHPLSAHAREVLKALLGGPCPTQEINAGVVNRLHRESLSETVQRPSPYAAHKGRSIGFEQITEAGRAALARASGL